jgi:hypothetical protein
MQAYGGVDIGIHVFLSSALVADEWSASHLCRFTPWVNPLDRRLSGLQGRSGRYGEVKILDRAGARTTIPRSSSPQPVLFAIMLFSAKWDVKVIIYYWSIIGCLDERGK